MGTRLSERLKKGTAVAHREIEGAGFLGRLFGGGISREEYGQYLGLLHPIYTALETGLSRNVEDWVCGRLLVDVPWRLGALEEDLAYYGGRAVAVEELAIGRRIEEVSREEPWLLAAYYYTRYLGDLSGGQMIGRRVREMFGLESDQGIRFYQFPEGFLPPERGKARLRGALDRLELGEMEIERLVEESVRSFELHEEIFERLK